MLYEQWMLGPYVSPERLVVAWIGIRCQDRQIPIHRLRMRVAVERGKKRQTLVDSRPIRIRRVDRHDLGAGVMSLVARHDAVHRLEGALGRRVGPHSAKDRGFG